MAFKFAFISLKCCMDEHDDSPCKNIICIQKLNLHTANHETTHAEDVDEVQISIHCICEYILKETNWSLFLYNDDEIGQQITDKESIRSIDAYSIRWYCHKCTKTLENPERARSCSRFLKSVDI